MAEQLQVRIASLGAQGDGVASHEDVPVYVPGALPGEEVLATVQERKKGGLYCELAEVVVASPERIEPACPHFSTCGGCQLQHMSNSLYAEWIGSRASMALAQHRLDTSVIRAPMITPQASRRRIALKALKVASGVVLGFNERQSHRVIDLSVCPVTRRELTSLFASIRTLLQAVLKQGMAASVHLTLTSTGVDMLVEAPMPLDLAARETLVDFANEHDLAALHWQEEGFLDPVAIRREPVMNFSGTLVPLPPASFVQASTEGETDLVAVVTQACEGYGRVADLFAGVGTFTFALARSHQVLAVEGAKGALEALTRAANISTGLKKVVPHHRDLFRRPLTAKELAPFEAVVFDPPRAGAKEQVAELAGSAVQRIVAVSCNPNTFARDARMLVDGGYVLESVQPVDQFLWSPHLELVAVFTRAESV